MSAKNSNFYQLESAKSLAASFTSTPTVIKNTDNISYRIAITTSNSIGTFTVQVSNDYTPGAPPESAIAGTWADLNLGGTVASVPFANAANDEIAIDLNQLSFAAIRIKYTSATPGTGTCNIFVGSKRLGG